MKKALFPAVLIVFLLLAGCEKGPKDPWVASLPWESEWTCLLLGGSEPGFELEPETGKAALRTLLDSYTWAPAESEAEKDPTFRTAMFWCGEDASFTLTLNKQGEVLWNGSLYRPVGAETGEMLLADFDAMMKRGTDMQSPPPLTLRCGGETAQARVYGTYSWTYIPRAGWGTGCMSDAFASIESIDWLGGENAVPVLPCSGEITLSFSGRAPDSMTLYAFGEAGSIPVALNGLTFTPYAGVNTYQLCAWWDIADRGGFGDCVYILAADGSGETRLPDTGMNAELSLLSADAWGCGLTLTNRRDRDFNLQGFDLLRRTDDGGWEWMNPVWKNEDSKLVFKPGETVSFRLDWSRRLGSLEAGEYALLLTGYVSGADSGKPQYISLPFALGDQLPEPPGPLTQQELPEGISSLWIRQSRHRLMQTLTLTGEGKYAVDMAS